MTRNRVRYWADQRGWTVTQLYAQVLMQQETVSQSTLERLYRDPQYMASFKSLEALARVLNVKVSELIEDEP